MNIYDFDNTIIKGDSSFKFIKYSLFHHPLLVLSSLGKTIPLLVKYLFKKSNFEDIKSTIFSFVKDIDNLDVYMENFALENMKYIKKFYLERKKDDDTVISASFEFIVRPFCEKLGIKNIIATKYDFRKGVITSKNCKGEEKIKRFRQEFAQVVVKNAYSDSLSDIPMFNISENAYLVKEEKLALYNKKE